MAEKVAEVPVVNGEEGLQLTEKQLKKAAKKEAKKAKFDKKIEANKATTSVISICMVIINYTCNFFTKKTESKAKKKGNKEVLTYDVPTPKGEKKGRLTPSMV